MDHKSCLKIALNFATLCFPLNSIWWGALTSLPSLNFLTLSHIWFYFGLSLGDFWLHNILGMVWCCFWSLIGKRLYVIWTYFKINQSSLNCFFDSFAGIWYMRSYPPMIFISLLLPPTFEIEFLYSKLDLMALCLVTCHMYGLRWSCFWFLLLITYLCG